MRTMKPFQCGRSGKDRRQRQAVDPERRLGLVRRQSDIVPVKQIRSGKDRRQRHRACSFAVPERRFGLPRRQPSDAGLEPSAEDSLSD
jgi:hypothetical protein